MGFPHSECFVQYWEAWEQRKEINTALEKVVTIPGEMKGRIAKLEERSREIEKREKEIIEGKRATGERVKAAEAKLEKISTELGEAKAIRQKLLADGGDAEKITKRIKTLRDEEELLRDEIIGLEGKLGTLEKEIGELPSQKEKIQWDFVKVLVEVLGKALSQRLEEAGKVAPYFFRLYKCLPVNVANDLVHPSSPQMVIPRICWGPEMLGDFFSEISFMEGFVRDGRAYLEKRREQIREKLEAERGVS
jgi:hypothetical protein